MVKMLFPSRCLACGSFFRAHNGTGEKTPVPNLSIKSSSPLRYDGSLSIEPAATFKKFLGPLICKECIGRMAPVASPLCPMCGMSFKSRKGGDHLCEACIRNPRQFQTARAAGLYDGPLRILIHRLKYNGKIQLARPLGRILYSVFHRFMETAEIDAVVPVPLHIRRFRKRGFNQSHLLVREWVRWASGIGSHYRVLPRVLIRHRWTRPQSGLGRRMRIQNVKNAFRVNPDAKVEGRRILLVDDVFTTGVTLEECSRVLLKKGAKQVDVLTLARTP